jgi:hypothetical protein
VAMKMAILLRIFVLPLANYSGMPLMLPGLTGVRNFVGKLSPIDRLSVFSARIVGMSRSSYIGSGSFFSI